MSDERKDRPVEELKKIAVGIADGNIFCSMQIRPSEQKSMLNSVFMVLTFMEKKDLDKLVSEKVTVLFEDINKAGPMSINGYPCFFSCQTLTDTEWKTIVPMIEQYDKIKKQFVEG